MDILAKYIINQRTKHANIEHNDIDENNHTLSVLIHIENITSYYSIYKYKN